MKGKKGGRERLPAHSWSFLIFDLLSIYFDRLQVSEVLLLESSPRCGRCLISRHLETPHAWCMSFQTGGGSGTPLTMSSDVSEAHGDHTEAMQQVCSASAGPISESTRLRGRHIPTEDVLGESQIEDPHLKEKLSEYFRPSLWDSKGPVVVLIEKISLSFEPCALQMANSSVCVHHVFDFSQDIFTSLTI